MVIFVIKSHHFDHHHTIIIIFINVKWSEADLLQLLPRAKIEV